VDHVRPLSDGGDHYDADNLQALCRSCHARKTCREDGGFGLAKLIRRDGKPTDS